MESVTLTISDDTKEELKKFSWVNWSDVARDKFMRKIKRLEALEKFEKLLEKSEFTEEDALELSNKVKEERLKQLKEQGLI